MRVFGRYPILRACYGNSNLLVVEDNRVTADSIVLFLQQQVAATVIVDSGIDDVAAALDRQFDVVISDWLFAGRSETVKYTAAGLI